MTLKAEQIAEGLKFPEGPVWSDGALCFTEIAASRIDRGRLVERFVCHEKGMVTNCCFGGTDLYVTESRIGSLWRIPLGVQGLALRA